MLTRTLVFGFFTTACVMACTSGGSGGGTSSASSAQSFVSQYCSLTAGCCEKQGKRPDQAKCEQFYSVFTAQATYDPVKGQQCLDAARADATLCEGSSDATDAACEGVFKESGAAAGTKQPGETCEDDDECAPASDGEVQCSFFSKDGATVRKCQVHVRAKENDDCAGDKGVGSSFTSGGSSEADRVGICWEEDGLHCDFQSKKCLKRIAIGDPCESFSAKCVTGARCDSTQRVCVALKASGEDCEPSASSFDQPCQEKLYCNETTRKCTPTLAAGAACTKDVECGQASCVNGKCSGGSSTLLICAD